MNQRAQQLRSHYGHVHGRTRAVVVRCDEEDGHTWDVWQHGHVVASGYRTRAEARAEARKLNETDELGEE